MRSTRKTALAAVAITVAATACGHGSSTAPRAATPATPADPSVIVLAVPEPEPTFDDLDFNLDLDLDIDIDDDKPIDRLAVEPDPTGTGPQIALRFLRALQGHDDLAAARTLTAIGRLSVSLHGEAHLHRVMADVAAKSGLVTAGRCSSAARLNPDAAVVTCGARKIVVHVADGYIAGVQIAPWHPRGDVYHGPHTHAYSDVAL